MGEDRLDKFLKDQVYDHRTPVDAEALWEKIQEKQSGKKKDRRPIFWMWFGGSALITILAIGVGFYFLNSSVENNIQNTNTLTESNTIVENQNPNQNIESSTENHEKTLNQKVDEDSNTSLVGKSKTSISLPFKSDENQSKSSNPIQKESGAPAINQVVQSKDFLSGKNVLQAKVSEEAEHNVLTNQGDSRLAKEGQKLLNSETESLIEPIKSHENFIKVAIPAFLENPLLNLEIGEKTEDLSLNLPHFGKEETAQDQNYGRRDWLPSFGIYFQYGINQRILENQSSDTLGTYLSQRESSEKTLDFLKGGIDFRLKHKDGFYGKIGLEYEQITEKFEASLEESRTFTADSQVVQIIKFLDGTKVEVLDTATVTEITSFDKKIYNRYRLIELPVMVGYELQPHRSNWQFFGEVGASLNLMMKSSGEVLDPLGNAYDLKEDTDELFKDQVGLSIMANLGIGYDVTENLNLWASPSFKYRLSSFTTSDNLLKQNYWHLGLSIGLRYKL